MSASLANRAMYIVDLEQQIADLKAKLIPCEATGHHHGDKCNGGRVQCSNAQFHEDCRVCKGTGFVDARKVIADLTASLAALNDANAKLMAEVDRLKREYVSRSESLEAAIQGIAQRDKDNAKLEANAQTWCRACAVESQEKRAAIARADSAALRASHAETERDFLRRQLDHWFGCPACGERHPANVMCPPHEVRTTGQAWFHAAIREAKDREDRLTQQVARLKEAGQEMRTRLNVYTYDLNQKAVATWDAVMTSANTSGSPQTPDAPTPL